MADRFVNLQAELRAVENDVERAFGALVGLVQGDGFLANAAGIFHELQFLDQFVAFVLPLPAEGIGIGALLNFVAGKGVGGISCAGRVLGLMNVGAFRGHKPLLLAAEVEIGFGQGDAGHGAQFGIDLQQQIDILFDRNGERIDLVRRDPLGD